MKFHSIRVRRFEALTYLFGLWVLVFLGSCSSVPEISNEQEAQVSAPLVRVQDLEEQTWQQTLDLTAELHPWAAVTVAAELPGRVIDLPVEHGDRVQEGDLLARLDTDSMRAELARAEASLQSSQASLSQAERDLARGKALAGSDQGIVSENDVDRWLLAHEMRMAELNEARAALQVVQERLDDMEIRAPFSGVVSERHVEKGSWVSEGKPVVRIVDSRRLKARASVASSDRLQVKLENPAQFRSDVAPDSVCSATLRFLGQEADASTGTFLVEAEVQPSLDTGSEQRLLPGLQGTLSLVLATHEGLWIPTTSLLSNASGEHVFVVDQGKAHRRKVEVEKIDSSRLEVISGLQQGDRLVIQGQHRLSDQQEVEERLP